MEVEGVNNEGEEDDDDMDDDEDDYDDEDDESVSTFFLSLFTKICWHRCKTSS